jgi:hypothetical protein
MKRIPYAAAGPRTLLVVIAAALVPAVSAADSGTIPSGQRVSDQRVLEPVYNAESFGEIGYIMQPEQAPQPLPANPVAWAPFYLVVYPVTSTVAMTTTLLCQHLPVDNCPTHGNGIASLAQAREPSVYGVGVAGHDHVMDFPGGSDFNIAWEPTVILFTPQGVADGAVDEHLLTDDQIDAAVSSGDAIEIPLPARTFVCASVPELLYDRATPLTVTP